MQLETGSVVRFRNRLWRIDRVGDTDFGATPLDGRDTRRWRFLRSLEEPLVQPGELPPPDPEVISDPARQDLLLRAHRLSLIHGSAPFLGLQRSRAVPEAYQLVPLLMALDASPVRLLIGDDVGIGKTIEAGLIVSELVARGSVQRVLVAVPPALREQWQEALSRFFHLDAVIMAGHTRPALERQLLPGQSPWEAFPIVVASIDYLKRRTGEVLSYPWDLVLVDEVHVAAEPPSTGFRPRIQKERWEFLQQLSKSSKVQHLLFLSATPHPGDSARWASLLGCLEPEMVGPNSTIRREVARRHVVQRRRKDIQSWYGADAPFPERKLEEEVIPLSKPEAALLRALREYGQSLQKAEGSAVATWLVRHLERRALSSPGAIAKSLKRRIDGVRKGIRDDPEERKRFAAEAQSVVLDQDSTSDLDDEERFSRLDRAATLGTPGELEMLEELRRQVGRVSPRSDAKLQALIQRIPTLFRRRPQNPRVLVFTRYKDTLDYLKAALERETKAGGKLAGSKVFTIYGDLGQRERREVFKKFESAKRAICVATDCISEGLDLQRACAELVHYEPPWNPNRFEQRCGRVDRYGQPEETVGITTFVRDDPVDVAVLERNVRRAAEIREAYGFCPVFFSSSAELKRLISTHGASSQLELPFDVGEDMPGALPDPFDSERIRRIEEESFYGQSDVRLPQVEEALQKTYRTVGSPTEVEGFVRSGLERSGVAVEERGDGTYEVQLAGTSLSDLGDEEDRLSVTFDPRLARDDPDLDLLDLAHPLVRRLIEDVIQGAAGSEEGRIAARGTTELPELTAIIHLVARYVTASEPPVLMEELIPVAFLPYGGKPPQGDPVELLRRPASPLPHTKAEIKRFARDALEAPALQEAVAAAVEARRLEIEARQHDVAHAAGSWPRGMDKVEHASVDPLSLTLLVPVDGA